MSWCKKLQMPRGQMLSLEQAWQLALGWYADRLEVDHQRKPVEEAQALFNALGMTGEFWTLGSSHV